MTEDRKSLLESIGFVWESRSKDTRIQHFRNLKKYATKEGHYNAPRCYSESKQLGIWVNSQIAQNSLLQEDKQSIMTEDRKNSIDEVSIIWDLQLQLCNDAWAMKFKELIVYKRCHGNCNVPHHYSKNPQLANWTFEQRSEYKLFKERKSSHINEGMAKALEEIGFMWNVKKRKHKCKATFFV